MKNIIKLSSLVIIQFLFGCSSQLKKSETFYQNGNVKTSGFEDKAGKLQGEFTTYFENGEVSSIGYMKDNMMKGTFKQYYENGNLESESQVFNNTPHGLSKCYYKSGNIEIRSLFYKGKLMSRILYYENGKIKGRISGKKHGEKGSFNCQVFFYPNGKIKKEDKGRRSVYANVKYIHNGKGLSVNLKGNDLSDSIVIKFKKNFITKSFIRKILIQNSNSSELVFNIYPSDYFNKNINILIESYYLYSIPNVKLKPLKEELCIQLKKGEKPAKYNIDPIW